MDAARLTIQGIRIRIVDVPLDRAVQTSAGAVASAPLVLVDLTTHEGVVGRAYIFTYTSIALGPTAALLANLESLVRDEVVAPAALSRTLAARFKLLGKQGLVAIALAALDMAAWDTLARSVNLPLARLLGASGTERIRAYASLRGWTAADLVEEAGQAVASGFEAVKLKVGHSTLEADLAVVRAVRGAVGERVQIMLDPNQAFTVPEAIRRGRAYADAGTAWLEEPVRADDLAGHARVRTALTGYLPIQRGENDWGPEGVALSLAAGASDLIMADVMKVGGVTGWLASAAQAEAAGIPISSHLFVEFSSHLLAASPGCHWLEWLDLAAPILAGGSPQPNSGYVVPSGGAGVGLEWDEAAVARFAAG